MRKVKHVCPKCQTAVEYRPGEKIFKEVSSAIISILAIFGLLFIIYISIMGFEQPIFDVMNAKYYRASLNYDDELRNLAINMTKECNGDNSRCYAKAIYQNLSDIRYVPSSLYSDSAGLYDPLYVYENGGDCKNTANLYVALLKSVGISAKVSCNIEETHCISVVPYVWGGDYSGTNFAVDLTGPIASVFYDDEDEWDVYTQEDRILSW